MYAHTHTNFILSRVSVIIIGWEYKSLYLYFSLKRDVFAILRSRDR